MKVSQIAKKVAKKIAKGKEKIVRKTGNGNGGKACGMLAFAAAHALALGLTGCASADLDQAPEQSSAQRAQTITAKFVDCQIYIGGTNGLSGVEFLTQTQANETSGTESYAHTPTQTPTATQTPTNTTDLKFDAKYNDAIAGASTASMGILETLTYAGANKVLSLMQSKATGTVTVANKDGTTTTVQCKDGQCSPCEDGVCNP